VSDAGVEISLLLPTRERPALVQRLLDSLVQTTVDLQAIEVVLYIDDDDLASQEICHGEISLIKIVGGAGQTMGSMNRACYDASHGRLVMLINDDTVFRTKGWDTRILKAAGRFTDGIALIYGNDLDQGDTVPTFPIVPRTVCEVLGEICPRGYQNLHIESHLLDIFKQLARMGHNRICYLGDVIFEHMHYVVGKAANDPTYIKKNQRNDDLLFIALDNERALKAHLLAQHIEAGSAYQASDMRVGPRLGKKIQPEQRWGWITRLRRMFLRH
jgi:hypothetical protein